jgi:NADH-quinone oxidoreductase subunit N
MEDIKDMIYAMRAELMVAAILFLLLILKLGQDMAHDRLLSIVQLLLLVSAAVCFVPETEGRYFGGMFMSGGLAGFQKGILATAVWLISLLFCDWLKQSAHMTEFLVLMLSSLVGMYFMISAGHLLMFYLSLELATIPVAAIAAFDLGRRTSSEGAMKLILSSALSSGVLLFGISLIYGATGTLDFSLLTQRLDGSGLQVLAFVFLLSAFAFKLSVVPFHLWTADVYEGSPLPVTAYLSVVSKGAVAFVFTSLMYRVFAPMNDLWYGMVVVLSVITMVTGNLFALRQDALKRFLAFSSIAQVGFILVAVSGQSAASVASVTFFIAVYLFSNLAAFGVASVLEGKGWQRISDLKGLSRSNPLLAWMMALGLFSLAGIPPAAGFFGKLFLIGAGAEKGNWVFITIAGLNMIVSLYYYLKVVRVMFMDAPGEVSGAAYVPASVRFGLIVCAAGIILTGVLPWIYRDISALIP